MNLEPIKVFEYFKQISQVPRESGNEEAISNFLKKLGEDNGYEVTQDEVNNIIIEVPATKGYEDRKKVILQGHMDMVCEKGKDSNHDFTKDPIELIVDGDNLHANDTTLGADNGIGVAMALALAEEEHGPLRIIATVSEETTMLGAKKIDPSHLEGDYLINIDSEEEGVLTVSSAGGKLFLAKFKGEKENYSGEIFEVHLHGLLGGHSGMEIANNKGNMIKIIAEMLHQIDGVKLSNIDCGTKQNAIPREGKISVVCDESNLISAIEYVKNEFKDVEGNLEIEYKKENVDEKVFTKETTKKFVEFLLDLPTGPNTFLNEEEKVLESSSNLAIVKNNGDDIDVNVSLRYASSSLEEEFGNKYIEIAKKYDAPTEWLHSYPEWEFKKESKFREIVKKLYKEITNQEMKEEFTHGGLECGVFYKKNPQLDIISIGPDTWGAHTQKETLSIPSTKRVFEHLKEVLKNI